MITALAVMSGGATGGFVAGCFMVASCEDFASWFRLAALLLGTAVTVVLFILAITC